MPAKPAVVPGAGLRLDGRALALGYRFGSDTLLVLLDLAARATDTARGTVVAVSYRDIARRLGVSKDTVGRRVRLLRGVGVLVETDCGHDRFDVRSYTLHLDLAGVVRDREPAAV